MLGYAKRHMLNGQASDFAELLQILLICNDSATITGSVPVTESIAAIVLRYSAQPKFFWELALHHKNIFNNKNNDPQIFVYAKRQVLSGRGSNFTEMLQILRICNESATITGSVTGT